jgi:hypothetical protein
VSILTWLFNKRKMTVTPQPMSFYGIGTKFSDRKDCSHCHRLLGMKIESVYPRSPLNDGIRIQWECENCHLRTWDVLPYAKTESSLDKWKKCDLCAEKFLYTEMYIGAMLCLQCKDKMTKMGEEE